tara:strand:- start:486 stop:824 length:339 start_codon:yes stop_codon:yes gene_type:complete
MSMNIPLLPRVDRGCHGYRKFASQLQGHFKKKSNFPVRTPRRNPSSPVWRGFRRFRASPFFFTKPTVPLASGTASSRRGEISGDFRRTHVEPKKAPEFRFTSPVRSESEQIE